MFSGPKKDVCVFTNKEGNILDLREDGCFRAPRGLKPAVGFESLNVGGRELKIVQSSVIQFAAILVHLYGELVVCQKVPEVFLRASSAKSK